MGIIYEKDFVERVKKLSASSYKAGERSIAEVMDSHDLRFVESGDFCANLHIHTKYSDGIMSIPDFIQKAEKFPDGLFAITDHDTIEGAKELTKYEFNTNITTGVEISTVAVNFPKQPKPLPIHLLVYGFDPYNKQLNELVFQLLF